MIILRLSLKMAIKVIVSVAVLSIFNSCIAIRCFNFVVNIEKTYTYGSRPQKGAVIFVTLFKCEILIYLNNFCTVITVK